MQTTTPTEQALRHQFIVRFEDDPHFVVKRAGDLGPDDIGARIVWAALNAPGWSQWRGAGGVELAQTGCGLVLERVKAISDTTVVLTGATVGVAYPRNQRDWYIPAHWPVGVAPSGHDEAI